MSGSVKANWKQDVDEILNLALYIARNSYRVLNKLETISVTVSERKNYQQLTSVGINVEC
jgi:mannitol/fructose-specific phosphotransferase system IIA component